jgi:uncharacterized protein (DUF1501 family)
MDDDEGWSQTSPEAVMRRFDWKTLIGSGALLATFVLALPGVKAVRAEESGMPLAPASAALAGNDGPTCSQPSAEAQLAQSGAAMEQLRQQIAAQLDPNSDGQIVMLNNRGYNYGSANPLERATIDLERLRAEQ